MFALICIVNICKLLCVYVKGVLLNEDLMMMMMMRMQNEILGLTPFALQQSS